MNLNRAGLRRLLLSGLLLMSILLVAPASRADDDEGEHRQRGKERRNHEESGQNRERWVFTLKHAVEPVRDPVYQKECGACHMAYQPALLPARSWVAVLSGLEQHFGHDASLSEQTLVELRAYTAKNAADTSRGETAYKILRSLGGTTPQRITEVPYIRKKHDELAAGVLQRKSISSLSNCAACHRSAERGLYDEDDVVIPQ